MNDTMPLYLRQATQSDCKLLFDWRNEPATRQNSFSQNEITFAEHIAWFEKMISDKNRRQYILMADDAPIGQIRVYVDDKTAEISYNIGREYQGKGFGTKMVSLIEQQIKIDFPHVTNISANVKTTNIASKRVFEKNLFSDSFIVYTKTIGGGVRRSFICNIPRCFCSSNRSANGGRLC